MTQSDKQIVPVAFAVLCALSGWAAIAAVQFGEDIAAVTLAVLAFENLVLSCTSFYGLGLDKRDVTKKRKP